MPSSSERELLKSEKTVVIGRKFLINQDFGFVFILPFTQDSFKLPKEFKEECRVLKIEPKLRTYLYKNKKAFLKIKELFSNI